MISRGFTYISLVYNKRQEKICLRPPNLKVKNTRPSVIKCVVFVSKKLWWDTLLLYQTHHLYTIMPLALYSETYYSFLYNNSNHRIPLLIQATIHVATVDVHQIFLKTKFKCLKLLSLYCTKVLRLLKFSAQLDTGVHIAPPQCDNRLLRYIPD